MKIVDVTDNYGRRLKVDASTQKISSYNNKEALITYNAEIVENGTGTGFWTEYVASGKVDNIEDRINIWNGVINVAYCSTINFDASKNDPNGEIKAGLIEYIKNNQGDFFDECGDWKSDLIISSELIKEIARERYKK